MSSSGADWTTLARLAFRHLFVKPGRALMLLAGYAVGSAVMMVLLAVGEAMVVQSRDVNLVGGGDVLILPEGIDLEALRTGATSGMFFGIDRARFLERQWVGGPRHRDVVAGSSPVIEHELLYLERHGERIPIRAGGEIPSRAAAVGAGLTTVGGTWVDEPGDSQFVAPSAERLYHELDRWHPPLADSTWAEWHYFNVAKSADEWWYLAYTVGPAGTGGQFSVDHHRVGAPVRRYLLTVPQSDLALDTLSADLGLGAASITQRDGRYHLVGRGWGGSGGLTLDLIVVPAPNAYFPPVELRPPPAPSGYVVPAVRATATGRICEEQQCQDLTEADAYHDHNWGVWRGTAWNWGQARGQRLSVVYGGLAAADSSGGVGGSPYLVIVVDSLGIDQVLRGDRIDYPGSHPIQNLAGMTGPGGLVIRGARNGDTARLEATIKHINATQGKFAKGAEYFLQMRGPFSFRGTINGRAVADSGLGFFETFVRSPARSQPTH